MSRRALRHAMVRDLPDSGKTIVDIAYTHTSMDMPWVIEDHP
jgi:hypothetical protein